MPTLDDKQETVRHEFTRQINANLEAVTRVYLERYQPVLSIKKACKLSTNYNQSDRSRGYYRPAVTEGARLVLEHAWKLNINSQNSTKKLPVLLIIGGGPGSGRSTALSQPPLALKKRILCIYDLSNEPVETVKLRITEAHALNIPTILAYIHRPLPEAAKATINQAFNETVIPSPDAFAISHYQNLGTFLSLSKIFATAKKLFSATVVLNIGPPENLTATKPSFLKNTIFTIDEARAIFSTVLAQISNPNSTSGFYSPSTLPQKRTKAPKAGKTLTSHASLIGHLLAQGLRSTLIQKENQATPNTQEPLQHPSPPVAEPGDTLPTQTLINAPSSAAKEQALELKDSLGQTLHGQERALDRERPERIVVRETCTHTQEMESLLLR